MNCRLAAGFFAALWTVPRFAAGLPKEDSRISYRYDFTRRIYSDASENENQTVDPSVPWQDLIQSK